MKAITIRDLHLDTGRWVRRAAAGSALVVTDRGRPVATLHRFDAAEQATPPMKKSSRTCILKYDTMENHWILGRAG